MGNVSIRSLGTNCKQDTAPNVAFVDQHFKRADSTQELNLATDLPGSDSVEHPATDFGELNSGRYTIKLKQEVQKAEITRVVSFQQQSPAENAHERCFRERFYDTIARIGRNIWVRRNLPAVGNVLLGAGETSRWPRASSGPTGPSRIRPVVRVSRRRWRQGCETQLLHSCWPVRQTEQLFLPIFPIDARRDRLYENRIHLADGAFGRVYRVCESIALCNNSTDQRPTKDTPAQYALKILRKSDIIGSNAIGQLKDEVNIHTLCGHHPFIVRCIEFWQTRTNIFLLSKYYGNGELFQQFKTFPSELTRLYVAELALALDFLHNAGIIYRDLKPENILLDEGYHIKLIDFGLSKWLSIGSRTATLCGTVQYMGKEA